MSSSTPARTAALASCSLRMSAARIFTPGATVKDKLPFLFTETVPRSPSGSSSGSRSRPVPSTTPLLSISASASTMPVPQMPLGYPPPMTTYQNSPWAKLTLLMAPGTERMPQLISAPSNAGPQATEQLMSPSLPPSTISPLVPMSSRRRTPSFPAMPVACTAATVSPPM